MTVGRERSSRADDPRFETMRINAWVFLGKVLLLFAVTYLAWKPVAPYYTNLLFEAARIGVWISELSSDPLWHAGTTLLLRGTGIFYTHRNFAAFTPTIPPQGIPAEWVMANLVLLIPLMLATPAPSRRARFVRLAVALAIALLLQVADIVVAIKSFYASTFRGYWSPWAGDVYQFLDAFFQSWDTQLFPFAIWAGVHFRQLLGGPPGTALRPHREARPGSSRAERRREQRGR